MDNYPSGWAIGWTAFAGIMMVIGGIWWIIAGKGINNKLQIQSLC